MRSVKMDADVDDMLIAMKGHHGATKSDVVRKALRALQQGEVEATKVRDQVRLTYEGVTRIELLLEEKSVAPPMYKVE